MSRETAVADAHFGNPGKGRLKGGQQLRLHLAFQPIPGVVLGDVAADVGVEQQGIADMEAVFAKAADADFPIQTDVPVNHPEGDGAGRAVFAAHQLFQIEVVYPLILGLLAAKGEALAHGLEGFHNAGSQVAAEDGRLTGGVIGKFAWLGGKFHNLALVHNHHGLTVCHGDDAAVCDDVVILPVGRAAGNPLFALDCQHVLGHGIAVKILFPLVSQGTTHAAHQCFQKSHLISLLFIDSSFFVCICQHIV